MKLVLALSGVMLAIALATLLIWRRAPAQAPCDAVDVAEARSPDGLVQADVFEVRCGDSVSTHVALRPAGKAKGARSDVFIAAGSVAVQVAFSKPRELAIAPAPAARVLVEEARWRDVTIRRRPR